MEKKGKLELTWVGKYEEKYFEEIVYQNMFPIRRKPELLHRTKIR